MGVAAVLGTTFTGHKDNIVGINSLLLQIREERGARRPAARGRRERRLRLALPLSRLRRGLPLPLVAFRLAAHDGFDEFDISWQLSSERDWMVPAYTLPPDAQDVTIMRALVKETLGPEHVDTLSRDIDEACRMLARKGGALESEHKKVITGPGH